MEREFEAAQARHREEIKRDLMMAWHMAAFTRAQHLPSLQTVLSKVDGKPVPVEPPMERKMLAKPKRRG